MLLSNIAENSIKVKEGDYINLDRFDAKQGDSVEVSEVLAVEMTDR